jgi:dihydroorotase
LALAAGEPARSREPRPLGADPSIEPDTRANLTLFDPAREWTLNDKTNYSKSRNSPWLNKTLKGKAIAVFNNGRVRMDEQL